MKLSISGFPVLACCWKGASAPGEAAGEAPCAPAGAVVAGAPAAFGGVAAAGGTSPGAPGCVAGAVGARVGSVVVAPGAPGAPGAAGAPVAGAVCAGGAAGSVGAAPVGAAGEPVAGGGVWPNDVSARVREQREAVSSFFIGVEGKVFTSPLSDAWLPRCYPQRDHGESSKTFHSAFQLGGAVVTSHHLRLWDVTSGHECCSHALFLRVRDRIAQHRPVSD